MTETPKSREPKFEPARADILPVFSIPFLRGILDIDTELVAESVRELVAIIKERNTGNVSRDYTTYFDEDIRTAMHEFEWYKEFSDRIKDTYISFIAGTFEEPVDHLNRNDIHLFSWISRYEGHHQHEIHNHVHSHISGTWYIKTSPSTMPIRFYSPNIMSNFSHNAPDHPQSREDMPNIEFTGVAGVDSEMFVHPMDGEFLMWPSYIMHSVPPNYEETDDKYERISLSFNLKHRDIIDNNETGQDMSYGFFNDTDQR